MRRPMCLVAYGLFVALAAGCSQDAAEQPPQDPEDQAIEREEPADPGESDGPAEEDGSGGQQSEEPRTLQVDAARLRQDDVFFDWSTTSGDLRLVEHGDGLPAIEATYEGNGQNGYARVQFEVDWDEGDEVEYGLYVYLPDGFMDALSGAVDLIRWDNWVTDAETTDHGGVALGSDGRVRLITEQLGVSDYEVLLGPVEVEEESWIWIEVRQVLSSVSGLARNELYIDGDQVAANREANHYGRAIRALRAGIVSIDSDAQEEPLLLYFDDVSATPG